jgi:hypothetical protein
MFGKKSELKSKEEPISTADENQDLNSTNIFDEFSTDDSIEAEVQKLKEEQNKDLYYFLNIF